jgi:hypothetical protein
MGAAMKKGVAPKLRWGRFRLQVIGPLLASPAASGKLQAKLRELSERVYRHPLDPEMSMLLGFSTIERWYYQAKDAADPIVALSRKTRSDAGRREALSEARILCKAPLGHTLFRGMLDFERNHSPKEALP